MTQVYELYDNGDGYWLAVVNDNNVQVLAKIYENDNYDVYHTKKILDVTGIKVFIGMSSLDPYTKFSGGNDINGTSILVQLNQTPEYLYIGNEMYRFKTLDPIIEYVSPVGNNSVPYPFALDKHGRYYLMIEKKIVFKPGLSKIISASRKRFEQHPIEQPGEIYTPYDLYYDQKLTNNEISDLSTIDIDNQRNYWT